MAAHAGVPFWYVLPSLPMVLLIPALLRHGMGLWSSLLSGCALTIVLYVATIWIGQHSVSRSDRQPVSSATQ